MKNKIGDKLQGKKVVGKVVILPLSDVKPNPWNTNEMEVEKFDSLKHGLEHEGWLSSDSLLVWNTDDKGNRRGLIIDGEHRWRAAAQVGMQTGPMVLLDDLPEKRARALTLALNERKGKSPDDKLAALIKSIIEPDGLKAIDVGLTEAEVHRLLAFDVPALPPAPPGVPEPRDFSPVSPNEQGALDTTLEKCPTCGAPKKPVPVQPPR